MKGEKQSDDNHYTIYQKKLDLFYTLRYLFTFIMSSNNWFCLSVSNYVTKENTCSYSADIAGIEYILRTYFDNLWYSFSYYNYYLKGKRIDKIEFWSLV